MSLKLKDMENSSRTVSKRPLPEEGSHPARVIGVIDLGVQERPPYKGKEKPPVRQVFVNFELVTSEFEDEEGEVHRHRISPRKFNVSSNENSALYKFLKAIDPHDTINGDLAKLLNKACLVQVVHAKVSYDGQDRTYANVAGVSLPPKGFEIPAAESELQCFDFDDPDIKVFQSLPEFLQEMIKNAVNFEGSKLQKLLEEAGDEEEKAEEEFDDEVPF